MIPVDIYFAWLFRFKMTDWPFMTSWQVLTMATDHHHPMSVWKIKTILFLKENQYINIYLWCHSYPCSQIMCFHHSGWCHVVKFPHDQESKMKLSLLLQLLTINIHNRNIVSVHFNHFRCMKICDTNETLMYANLHISQHEWVLINIYALAKV